MTTTPRQPLFCAHADTNGDPGRCACGQQLADVGPATPPPPWCEPGTEPIWEQLTERYGGVTICQRTRYFPAGDPVAADVWIAADDRVVDGRVLRTQPAIHYTEPPVLGIGPAAARRLAAELLNAADTLDDGRRQLDDLGEHRR